jgi:hypothetical protein
MKLLFLLSLPISLFSQMEVVNHFNDLEVRILEVRMVHSQVVIETSNIVGPIRDTFYFHPDYPDQKRSYHYWYDEKGQYHCFIASVDIYLIARRKY